MQIVKGALLFGTLAKELWFIQPTNVLVEDVFVLSVAGQCTMHCIIQVKEFLRVLVKSLMQSLRSFFQRIDCINHSGEGGELHLQTFFQFDPRCGLTLGFEMREYGPTSFQSGNTVFSPMLIIG